MSVSGICSTNGCKVQELPKLNKEVTGWPDSWNNTAQKIDRTIIILLSVMVASLAAANADVTEAA